MKKRNRLNSVGSSWDEKRHPLHKFQAHHHQDIPHHRKSERLALLIVFDIAILPPPSFKIRDFHSHPKANLQTPPAFDFGGSVLFSGRVYLNHIRKHSKSNTMKTQLVYAEVMDGITIEMMADPLVRIISDTGVFIVTTIENSKRYQMDFYPLSAEVMEAYGLRINN